MAARFRVAIDAADAQVGKAFAQKVFDLLGAFADVVDVLTAACRTLRRSALVMIAVVTDQCVIAPMISQGNVAVWALDRFAARATENET